MTPQEYNLLERIAKATERVADALETRNEKIKEDSIKR